MVISLDFDETLWDLHEASLSFIKEHYGVKSLSQKDITYWEYLTDNFPRIRECWGDFQLYSKGKPIEGSIEFMKNLKKIVHRDDIQIVTASFPDIIEGKTELIKSLFDIDNIIHTSNKSEFTKNSILIDDGLHNIVSHRDVNDGISIIFDLGYGWNQNKIEDNEKIFRANSYDNVLDIIRQF